MGKHISSPCVANAIIYMLSRHTTKEIWGYGSQMVTSPSDSDINFCLNLWLLQTWKPATQYDLYLFFYFVGPLLWQMIFMQFLVGVWPLQDYLMFKYIIQSGGLILYKNIRVKKMPVCSVTVLLKHLSNTSFSWKPKLSLENKIFLGQIVQWIILGLQS